MSKNNFFKCNVLGGFRLSDLNLNIKQGEYFFIDSHVAEISRSVIAALKDRWMIEVTEKEAAGHITIPKEVAQSGVQNTNVGPKTSVQQFSGLATPNVAEVNKNNIESRQAENNRLTKPIMPDFKKAEEDIKKRQSDSMNKVGITNDKELVEGLKDTEIAIGPDLSKIANKTEENKTTVAALADDSVFDNSQVSTPNFDEKKEEVKQEVKATIEKKIRRRRKNKTEENKQTEQSQQVEIKTEQVPESKVG